MEDSGTKQNWIPPWMVRGLDVDVTKTDVKEVLSFDGTTIRSDKTVTLQLSGRDAVVRDVEFYVAPDKFPFRGATVGREYLENYGPINAHFLEDKPEDLALLVMQKRVTVSC